MTSAGAGWARWGGASTTSWVGSSAGGTISGTLPPHPQGPRAGRVRGHAQLRLALPFQPPAQMSGPEVVSQLAYAEKSLASLPVGEA